MLRALYFNKGLKTFHYDNHLPFRMNKKKFLECMSSFDFGENIGYTINSMYGNYHKVKGTRLFIHKVRVFRPHTAIEIEKKTIGRLYMTFNDNGLNQPLIDWLHATFPKPSKWEATLAGLGDVPKTKLFGYIYPLKLNKRKNVG